MEQFTIVSALRPLSPMVGYIGFKYMKTPSSLIHVLWEINGRSLPLSIKHTIKPKEFEFQRKHNILSIDLFQGRVIFSIHIVQLELVQF